MPVILLKLGELVLKGLNRARFEEALLRHVREVCAPFGRFSVSARQSIVTVEAEEQASVSAGTQDEESAQVRTQASDNGEDQVDWTALRDALSRVFGVAGLALAVVAPKDMEAIAATAKAEFAETLAAVSTFKVEARRSDKRFPLTSIGIAQELGGALHDAFPHLKADMRNPDVTVVCEIRDTQAYLHAGSSPGAGGLPRGMGGRGILLLSGGIDSPAAGYMMAKRGLSLTPIHFFSYPYTSHEARDKVIALSRILSRYLGKMTVLMAPLTTVQEAIRRDCPEPLGTILTRRFMMRAAGHVAGWYKASCLVTGESLGQVASQTAAGMAATQAVTPWPVLRPLVGMDKEEIVALARKIGTFETSVLPLEDCCTIFTPRHPKINPSLSEVEEAEKKLDVDGLLRGVLDGIEKVYI